jgi:hypothetical protein
MHVLSSATAYSTTQGSGTAQNTSRFGSSGQPDPERSKEEVQTRKERTKETTQLEPSRAYWIQNFRLGGSL